MVTAILPSLTDESPSPSAENRKPPQNPRASLALSLDSQLTITPESFRNNGQGQPSDDDTESSLVEQRGRPSKLAGYVGVFTGCGALVALSLFLPLPARFGQIKGVTTAEAVEYSFYIVGVISFVVAVFVFFGLRHLNGEDGKGWAMLFSPFQQTPDGPAVSGNRAGTMQVSKSFVLSRRALPDTIRQRLSPYWQLLRESISLGFTDSNIAIGYLGGFVARASTVAISLFVPLFINSFFIRNGFCQGSPNDPSPELKEECRQAYILSSILTGVAQLMGLICSPLFGYFSSTPGRFHIPIAVATTFGIVGYIALPQLASPEYKDVDGRGGSPVVFLLVTLIGISQIGAIVCSLGSLGRGVLQTDVVNVITSSDGEEQEILIETADGAGETAPLLEDPDALPEDTVSRVRLKGSIAGVYSLCGGAAILLLTKLGGYLFDSWSAGAPFYMMAVFNAILLIASTAIDVGRIAQNRAARRW